MQMKPEEKKSFEVCTSYKKHIIDASSVLELKNIFSKNAYSHFKSDSKRAPSCAVTTFP